MSQKLSAQGQWREIFRQQQLSNAKRWLLHLQEADDLNALISAEYDNVLRAMEVTLKSTDTFDLTYALIQAIFPVAIGFADWDRWQTYLEVAIEHTGTLQLGHEKGALLDKLAGLHYHKGEISEATRKYEEAGAIYNQIGAEASYARLLAMLAILQDLQGKSAEGIAICQKALAIAEGLQDEETIAHVSLNLSHIYYRIDEIEAGTITAERAYALYRKHNNWELATKSLLNLIALWAVDDKWEKINSATTDLMIILEEKGDVLLQSRLKINLGVVAFNQENFLMAEAMWQDALALNLQIKEPTELVNIYNNLGMVYTDLQEWETAEKMLQEGLQLSNQIGDIFREANIQDNLAALYISDGRPQEARETLLSAVEKIENWPDAHANACELLDEMRQRLAQLESA